MFYNIAFKTVIEGINRILGENWERHQSKCSSSLLNSIIYDEQKSTALYLAFLRSLTFECIIMCSADVLGSINQIDREGLAQTPSGRRYNAFRLDMALPCRTIKNQCKSSILTLRTVLIQVEIIWISIDGVINSTPSSTPSIRE